MGVATITSIWNPENESETTITFSNEWNKLSRIAKLDHLKDTLGSLTETYNVLLENFNKGEPNE